jgi:hypothetical protein
MVSIKVSSEERRHNECSRFNVPGLTFQLVSDLEH